MKVKQKYWFKAKKYGWGWDPSSWEGWLILALYIFLLLANFIRIYIDSQSISDMLLHFIPELLVLTFFLIVICYAKGEKPKWNWGGK